jgi:hypothetical protein
MYDGMIHVYIVYNIMKKTLLYIIVHYDQISSLHHVF